MRPFALIAPETTKTRSKNPCVASRGASGELALYGSPVERHRTQFVLGACQAQNLVRFLRRPNKPPNCGTATRLRETQPFDGTALESQKGNRFLGTTLGCQLQAFWPRCEPQQTKGLT